MGDSAMTKEKALDYHSVIIALYKSNIRQTIYELIIYLHDPHGAAYCGEKLTEYLRGLYFNTLYLNRILNR